MGAQAQVLIERRVLYGAVDFMATHMEEAYTIAMEKGIGGGDHWDRMESIARDFHALTVAILGEDVKR